MSTDARLMVFIEHTVILSIRIAHLLHSRSRQLDERLLLLLWQCIQPSTEGLIFHLAMLLTVLDSITASQHLRSHRLSYP